MENRIRQLEQQYAELTNREAGLIQNMRNTQLPRHILDNMNQQLAQTRFELDSVRRERDALYARRNMQPAYGPQVGYGQQPAYGGYQPGYQQPGYNPYPAPPGYTAQPYGGYPQQGGYTPRPAYPTPQPGYYPQQGYRPQPMQPMQYYQAPQPQPYYPPQNTYQQPYSPSQPPINPNSDSRNASKYDRYTAGVQGMSSVPQPQPQVVQPVVTQQVKAPAVNPKPKVAKPIKDVVELVDDEFKDVKPEIVNVDTRYFQNETDEIKVEHVNNLLNNLVRKKDKEEELNIDNLTELMLQLNKMGRLGAFVDSLLTRRVNVYLQQYANSNMTLESLVMDLPELLGYIDTLSESQARNYKNSLLFTIKDYMTTKIEITDDEKKVKLEYPKTSLVLDYSNVCEVLDKVYRDLYDGTTSRVTKENAKSLFGILSKVKGNVVDITYPSENTEDKAKVYFYKKDENTYISINMAI